MELTSEQLLVLTIFKEHDMEEGEYLSMQTLNRERLNLPQDIQDNWNDIIKSLMEEGYIALDPLGYGLTNKGHYQLHRSAD